MGGQTTTSQSNNQQSQTAPWAAAHPQLQGLLGSLDSGGKSLRPTGRGGGVMPIDPQDGGPDDWFVPESAMPGTARPESQPKAGSANPAPGAMPIDPQDGRPDDWFVPESDGYPNDWFVPESATPGTAPPAPQPPTGSANAAPSTRPAPRPDPLADYWSRVPASRVGAMAWHPLVFPNSPGQSPSVAAPLGTPQIDPSYGPRVADNAPVIAQPDHIPVLPPDRTPGTTTTPSTQVSDGVRDQADPTSLLDQIPDLETGLTPSQIRSFLSLFGSYMRANQPEIARFPDDVADMYHDATTDFPEFLRRLEPSLAGLGLAAPMSRAAGNVWLLNDMLRGRIAEMVHGRNLPFNFKTIDKFVNGIATSTKSVNLNAASYQDANALYYTLRSQINKVADFIGARLRNVVIQEHEIKGRALDVLVPHTGTAAQRLAIKQAIDYGARQGVTVNIIRHQ